jgi:hypothetical protein
LLHLSFFSALNSQKCLVYLGFRIVTLSGNTLPRRSECAIGDGLVHYQSRDSPSVLKTDWELRLEGRRGSGGVVATSDDRLVSVLMVVL